MKVDNGRIHLVNATGRVVRLGSPEIRRCPDCAADIPMLSDTVVIVACDNCGHVVKPIAAPRE